MFRYEERPETAARVQRRTLTELQLHYYNEVQLGFLEHEARLEPFLSAAPPCLLTLFPNITHSRVLAH